MSDLASFSQSYCIIHWSFYMRLPLKSSVFSTSWVQDFGVLTLRIISGHSLLRPS